MRLTAMRVPISDVEGGVFLKQPGEWGSSYVLNEYGLAVSRVSIVAYVLDRFLGEASGSLTLDDTTGTIRARFFEDSAELLEKVQPGDLVEIVGKVREYKGERQLIAESLVVLDDENWWLLRKAEIALLHRDARKWHAAYEKAKSKHSGDELREALSAEGLPQWYVDGLLQESSPVGESDAETESVESDVKHTILDIISDNELITYTDIIKESGLESDLVDKALTELIDEGEIFEPRSGKFKRL